MKKVHCTLFHNPVEITSALIAVAGQENCDGPEYDLMMEAADYIRELEKELGMTKTESINSILYCSPSCPHLEGERESVNKRCTLLNQELGFYDWHLAICEPDEGENYERR